ncbi:MAG: DUF2188 domain-containing protein [Solirubrobacterales bacterium]|nr:DUF2188 domain-containing protein [Solirubrobacterales bacterium]
MSDFEVVRSDVDGWDVRRVGEAQALSNHASREDAEKAAELHGGDADEIDVRQDVFSEDPEEDVDAKKTLLGAGAVMIAVILLMVVVAVIVATTGIGR